MEAVNLVVIEGYLTADPKLEHTPKGTPLCTFSIGVNRSYKDLNSTATDGSQWKREVSFIDITTWAGVAKAVSENLKKGRLVRVSGSLRQDRWTDNDGKSHSRVRVIAERVIFGPRKDSAESDKASEPPSEVHTQNDEDIPF